MRKALEAACSERQRERRHAQLCCDPGRSLGCWIVTGSRDGSLCVWHVALNRLVFRVEEAHANCLTAVAFQRKKWWEGTLLAATD